MNFYNTLKNEKDCLFHFYIILGNLEENSKDIFNFLEKEIKFLTKNNINFYNFKEPSFSIKLARKIKKINSIKNSQEDLRIFLIESQSFDLDSQNAMLKTFEEPQKNTLFFLLLPLEIFLIETIKSRARILTGKVGGDLTLAQNFLRGTFLIREKIIIKIKKIKEPREKRESFLKLLEGIDILFLENKTKFKKEKDFLKSYKMFLELKDEAKNKGAGLSYVLIFLSIILPRI